MPYDPNLNEFGPTLSNALDEGPSFGRATPATRESRKKGDAVINDVINRGLNAVRAPKGHKLEVLFHGESPEEADRNNQWWYQRSQIQDDPKLPFHNRAARAVSRTVQDLVMDPLTPLSFGIPGVAGGRTLGGIALHQAERYALPAVAKASVKLTKVHPRLGELFDQVHNLGVDSEHKRALALKHGPDWHKNYAQHYVARNAVGNKSNTIERSFRKEFDSFVSSHNHEDLDKIFRAVDGGHSDALPQHLQTGAKRFKTMFQAMEHLEGSDVLHQDLQRRGYDLSKPPSYAAKHVSDQPRGLQSIDQSREHYVPAMREARERALTGSGLESEGRSGLSTHDPHLMERSDNVHYKDVTTAIAATKHRIRTMAQAVAAHDVIHDARYAIKPEMLHDPVFKEFFTPTIVKSEDKNQLQRNLDVAKVATDFEKAGVFMTPTGHMARIGALAAIDDPVALAQAVYAMGKSYVQAIPKAMKLKQSILDTEHEMRNTRMQNSLDMGAVQAQSVDRHSPFIDALKNPSGDLKNHQNEIIRKVGQTIDKVGNATTKPASKIFEWSGHVLWHFDDEVKHAAFTRKVKGGMDPAEAALETNANLVDYTNRSGLAKGVSPIVPFSTWRTKMPLAVMRGMIQRPALVSAGSRMAPAAFGGDQDGYGSGLPYADVSRMMHDPSKSGEQNPTISGMEKWGRGSLAPWMRFAAGELDGKGKKDWWTGFSTPGQYLEEQIPVVGNAMQWSGHGPYGDSPYDAILQSLTTVTHPGKKSSQSVYTPQLFTANPSSPSTTTTPAPPTSGYDPNLNEFK